MEWTSCLYECQVIHHRTEPKTHRLEVNTFGFCLDLSELEDLAKHLPWFAHNRFGFYSFWDKDYAATNLAKTLQARLDDFVAPQVTQIHPQGLPTDRRWLVFTNVRTLGYLFNPVSFYWAVDAQHKPLAALVEVGNTFYETKLFHLDLDPIAHMATDETPKHFYVSPYLALTDRFRFRVGFPGEQVSIGVDTLTPDRELLLTAQLFGQRIPLTQANLVRMTWRYPWITAQVIAKIHWHALLLWLKGIPFHLKESHPEQQVDILNPHPSLHPATHLS
jgi:DUF1365 family protein